MGKTQHHRVAVCNEDRAHVVGARAGREQRKAAPEERLGGIGDLDCRRVVYRWVVDRGMKVFDRSTVLTGLDCGKCAATESMMGGECAVVGNGSMPGSGKKGC